MSDIARTLRVNAAQVYLGRHRVGAALNREVRKMNSEIDRFDSAPRASLLTRKGRDHDCVSMTIPHLLVVKRVISGATSGQNADPEEAIFSAALQLRPGQERVEYLESACAGRESVRLRVEALLRASPGMGDFMENIPSASLDHAEALAREVGDDGTVKRIGRGMLAHFSNLQIIPEEVVGKRIGRYKLLQKLGEGGCGVVYMAEQEEPVKRRVALKVIKLGMDTKSVIARFEAERQALAMMDHPNIAKVLDADATENGRPYFVMELVRGVKITEFCDQNQLSTRERLDLFIQVCHAVQHAHQKGIIHRDLKPSNILVTINDSGSPGLPKIIDFGIAKATQGKLIDETLFTAFEQFLGTPAYMSPEQTLMTVLDVDTRSDIYSLGVLLYELLTGSTPFSSKDLMAIGFEEMRRTIREKEPPRPSTRLSTLFAGAQVNAATCRQTDPPKLIHLVRGDLDWIVMKCIEKDRTRRYETANALAQDLQRHLGNEPVAACPPSRLYELQKSIRRHKVGFASTAAVVIALAAGALISGLAAVRARRAELQTRRNGYVADMDRANLALIEGDLGIARSFLRRYWPRPHEADLRNWEWRYLANLSDGDPNASLVTHSAAISSLRFLDDDTLLTTGADWRTVLWNLRERRPSSIITNRSFGGGISDVTAVALKRNALFYRPKWQHSEGVTIVDLRNGNESHLLYAKGAVTSLDISPDQKKLAVASSNQVGLWDLDEKTWSQPFETESGEAAQCLFSPDGRTIVVADAAGHIVFWNLAERTKRFLRNDSETLGVLKFSVDGRWLINPRGKSATRVWNVEDLNLVAELPDSASITRAAASPDRRWIATVGVNPGVGLWETSSWRKARTLRGHTDPLTAVDFTPNGHFLATASRSGEVKLWSLDEPKIALAPVSFLPSAYFELAADGSGFGRIPPPGSNGVWTAEVWTTTPLERTLTVPLAGPPASGVILAGSQGAVLGGYDGSIRVIGPRFGTEIAVTNAHKSEVYIMDVSLDGSTLATKALDDEQVRIWRLPRLEPIAELAGAEHVHYVKLSDDGKLLAGFTGPGDIGVWEIPSMRGPPMWHGLPATQNLRACAFSPDNRWLATAGPDGGTFLWNVSTHRRTPLPRALTQYDSLSFSPDSSRLAAGSEGGESKLFDVATGQAILSFKQPGLKLAFARDGQKLLAVHSGGATLFQAPAFEKLQFDWLKEKPPEEPPTYLGPQPNYKRPGPP